MKDLIRESLKENIRNNLELYTMCCIPVFPFFLSADFLAYSWLEDSWIIGNGLSNCLLLIVGVLLLVCFAIFRYTLSGYIKKKQRNIISYLFWAFQMKIFGKYLPKNFVRLSCYS